MLPEYYKIRCDKHQFKPFEYCEMCMVRNELQNCIEEMRKETRSTVSQLLLGVSVLNDCFDKCERQIKELQDAISEGQSCKE